jgi:hypothetical protein
MYKARNLKTHEDIIILSPRWIQQLPLLRSLDHGNVLVCPECLQPVRVRAGQRRRYHFAHKHLGNCPYQNESPMLLDSRAVLYEWLVAQFGENSVNLEVKFEIPNVPRAVDCLVSTGEQTIAYWIIERRMPPDERDHLIQFFEQSQIQVHWIFVSGMLRIDENQHALILSTTEREFMGHSVYNEFNMSSIRSPGKSLHYLDSENKQLMTYRALRVVHAPQSHIGHLEHHPLSIVRADAENGEPIHPGESDRVERIQKERLDHEVKIRHAADRFQKSSLNREDYQVQETQVGSDQPRDPFSQREAVCMFCGTMTNDWWYLNASDGKCKCRECLRKGVG